MNKSNSTITLILKGALAIILGYIALRIVNLPRNYFLSLLFENGLSSKGFPTAVNSQIVFLIYIFIAGLAGSYVVGLFSKRNYWTLLLIFGGLLMVNDIFSVLSPLSDQPIWVKVLIFVTLPIQIWVGGILGMRTRRARESE
jgi:hypothetical protein